ncbi:hypothetical protein like AT4G21970 [Hibiscus trionum]|uniref:Senescence regulator n=1 Tax=Hibiscus trionum TaxID=183268 RepID=A0A9W7MPW5_HIBTR|nr:hypothetical protein like AT4G21970 [Hibiscus trionum]
MEDRYGYSRKGSGVWRSLRDGDFEEEDVWAVLKETKDSNTIKLGQSIEESSSVVTVRRHLPSAARMIPRTFSAVNTGSSSSSSSSGHEANDGAKQQQSAPVNIPDWSKFSRKNKPKKGSSWHDDDEDDDDRDFDDDDEFDTKLPPHEFLAKRIARSRVSSFSVFEGVGRKLKGRDLRKVRNAVLTRTGFLE